MSFDINKMYERLRGVHELLLPDAPNMRRVRTAGGVENRVGEVEGGVEETMEFRAVVWKDRSFGSERGGGMDGRADMELHYADDILEIGDVVERIADGKRFRVDDRSDLGGPSHPMGHTADLSEVDDR